MDRNGYNPSILHAGGECFLCHIEADSYFGGLCRHEIYGGANRQKSKRLGLWVNLCPRCHDDVHHYPRSMKAVGLKMAGQKAIMERGWSKQKFITEIGENYL